MALNATYPELYVNFLEYWEVDAQGRERVWSWITNRAITRENAYELMRAGRARWKIENETFNTLKNQGLSPRAQLRPRPAVSGRTLAGLMLLAFLIDQIQEHACRLFQRARERWRSRRALWERLRALFMTTYAPDWEALMQV